MNTNNAGKLLLKKTEISIADLDSITGGRRGGRPRQRNRDHGGVSDVSEVTSAVSESGNLTLSIYEHQNSSVG